MKLSVQVLSILDRCRTEGPVLFLPPGQLDRPVYEAVNKVLVAAGGKWNRKSKGHVFDVAAADAIEPVILTGEVTNRKQEFGQFDTPDDVAAKAVLLCGIKAQRGGFKLLEPNAGTGALAIPAARAGAVVDCIEVDDRRVRHLDGMGDIFRSVACRDFIGVRPDPIYDAVLMNPPFAKRADVHHVNHAAKFLKPGGRLVAIMSSGVTFRSDQLTIAFRAMVESEGGSITLLPEDSFKASGTSVNAVLVEFTSTAF
jgi:predicted RNA methylase